MSNVDQSITINGLFIIMASQLDSFVEGLLTPMVNFVILFSSYICYISHFIITVRVVLSLFVWSCNVNPQLHVKSFYGLHIVVEIDSSVLKTIFFARGPNLSNFIKCLWRDKSVQSIMSTPPSIEYL